jgi:3-hydroxybutyryl-CoA dehydrogenase
MDVETIAIIGAGALGREVAQTAVLAGYHVLLEDISQDALKQAVTSIRRNVRERVLRGQLPPGTSERAKTCLHTSRSVKDAVRQPDLIIETAADELEMKLELFTIFDKFARPGAIFATTSSRFSIEDISDVTVSRDRCVGLEFLAPVAGKQLVELVRTSQTSEQTVATCTAVLRRMGRELIVVPPGSSHRAKRTSAVFRENLMLPEESEPEAGQG